MSQDSPSVQSPSTFGSVLLLALALTVFLGWQLWAGIRQYQSAEQVWDRQEVTARQAAETKKNFEAMMFELIELAETHPEARRIIRKYNVTFNPGTDSPESAPSKSPPSGSPGVPSKDAE